MALTSNAIVAFANNKEIHNPVVQVMDIRKVESSTRDSSNERYRFIVSDGGHYTQAMLSTQLNDLVRQKQVYENSIIRLTDYICNEVQGRNIVIILGLDIVRANSAKIGDPVNISASKDGKPAIPTPMPSNSGIKPENMFANNQQPQNRHPQQQNATRQYAQPPGSHASMTNAPFHGNGPVVKQPNMMQSPSVGSEHFVPIRGLNPYQNRWTFKARVINKGDIRTWDKGGSNKGKLFSLECVDKEGTEIRCTFFREAVDRYYDMLAVGEVYTFSKGQVKMANKAYNTTNNDYEITFGANCEIHPCVNDNTIRKVTLNPTPIARIDPGMGNSSVDVLGVATEFGEVQEFTSKSGKALVKMELTLADNSNASVRVTLWGQKAHEYHQLLNSADPYQIIGIKGCKVSDYNGCSLSTLQSSNLYFNPELSETNTLKAWVSSGGLSNPMQSKSQQQAASGKRTFKALIDRHPLTSFEECQLGKQDKADYVDVTATVTYIKRENMWYPACPEEGENKKVVQQTDGTWYCEKNNKTYPNCEYRYILSAVISDSSGSRWMTCFNETGIQLMGGRTADELQQLKETNEAAFDQVLADANFRTYNISMRIKEEARDDEARLRCSAIKLFPVDFISDAKQMLAAIESYKTVQ